MNEVFIDLQAVDTSFIYFPMIFVSDIIYLYEYAAGENLRQSEENTHGYYRYGN